MGLSMLVKYIDEITEILKISKSYYLKLCKRSNIGGMKK